MRLNRFLPVLIAALALPAFARCIDETQP